MKISIITVLYNREKTIEDTIQSVLSQSYKNIEYIVLDGKSTDSSVDIIKHYKDKIDVFESEPDQGMYYAINKAIQKATGDVVGLLHSDDAFYSDDVIESIAAAFKENPEIDAVYGDGIFVKENDMSSIVRNWISGKSSRKKLKMGWLPLHPTVYIKRPLFAKYGLYDTSLRVAADTEFLLRYLYTNNISTQHINKYFVKMRMGGASTDFSRALFIFNEDLIAYRKNKIPALPAVISKKFTKFIQYISK